MLGGCAKGQSLLADGQERQPRHVARLTAATSPVSHSSAVFATVGMSIGEQFGSSLTLLDIVFPSVICRRCCRSRDE